MLKDLLNAAANAKAKAEEKLLPDYESRKLEQEKEQTRIRNAQRIDEAKQVARLCRELSAFIAKTLAGVQGVQVTTLPNRQAFDGIDPNNLNDAIQLGEVEADSTVVDFLEKKVEFKPICYAVKGAQVRCHWLISTILDGSPYHTAEWSVDSYSNEKSTLSSAMRIKGRKAMEFYTLEEYLELVFKKAFLSQ